MTTCSDKRFEEMLSAYCHGLLLDEDRAELEMHLMTCDACYEQVQRFQQAAGLMKTDADIRAALEKMVEDDTPTTQPEPMHKRFTGIFTGRAYLRIAVTAAFLLILLLAKPWRLGFEPSLDAVARENRLLVMYFENLADPADSLSAGRIIANLLITDLSESSYMQVVSAQRLDDVLENMGYDAMAPEIFAQSMAAARATDARLLVTGKILNDQPYEIVAQVINVADGTILSSRHLTGDSNLDLFAAADSLTSLIRTAIALPPEAAQEPARPVTEMTTTSVDAYRHYLKGADLVDRYYLDEGIRQFYRALEYDSTLAMAYYYLAFLVDGRYINLAVKYADGTDKRARSFIDIADHRLNGRHDEAVSALFDHIEKYPDDKSAYSVLGDTYFAMRQYRSARNAYYKALEIDSQYVGVYIQLGELYDALDNFDKARWAMDRFIDLSPVKASGYDALGRLLARHGRLDEAIETFETALTIKPDYMSSIGNLGYMSVFKGDYHRADSLFRILEASDIEAASQASLFYRIWIPVRQGKFKEALSQLTRLIEDDYARTGGKSLGRMEAHNYRLAAQIYETRGHYDTAIAIMRGTFDGTELTGTKPLSYFSGYCCYLLAKGGEIESADRFCERIKAYLEKSEQDLQLYWYALGCTELGSGNPEQAVDYFAKVSPTHRDIDRRFMKGLAYFEAGDFDRAVAEFRRLQSVYNSPRGAWQILDVMSHYYMGLAFEKLGRYNEAISELETFDAIWTNADAELREKYDVRERIKKLKAGS